jgi:gamma-F420-2:alpha-L-glutamate ligase
VLGLDVTGIDILFDEEGYRICEANSAPGFQGLERATSYDVPSAILEWVISTQDAAEPVTAPAAESNALAELAFGGRAGLRVLSDRNPEYRRFASAVGLRMVGAGLGCLAHASLPPMLVDRKSRVGTGLRTLFDGRVNADLSALNDTEQERTLMIVLVAAIWAAVLPWLAGADVVPGAVLSVIALCFPVLFMTTAPTGRFGRSASSLRRRTGG